MRWLAALVPLLLACSASTAGIPDAGTLERAREPGAANTTFSATAEPTPLAHAPTVASTTQPTPAATAELTPAATIAPTATVTAVPTRSPARATTAATPQPPATVPPAPRTGAYKTLPAGAALPSEAQCASEAVRDPWEPRPQNGTANQSNAWLSGFRLRGSYIGTISPAYEQRVTGSFTGTTNEIIRWAACKWGFDEEDVRAVAVVESTWRQSHLGDCRYTTQPETKGCASVGLMQIKGANIPPTHPGTWPAALTSTSFNVDYALAVRRLCYEGKETWLKQTNGSYASGDLWGCIGRWYSGNWRDAAAERYIAEVRATMNARPWLSPTF